MRERTSGSRGRLGGIAVVALGLSGAVVAGAVGWLVLVWYPGSLAELLGVVLVAGLVLAGGRLGVGVARSRVPGYNVAEVPVEGPISRGGGGGVPGAVRGTPADDLVEQLERADADPSVEALVVRLNTPGGEVVPSDDLRLAAESFDGPTVAYATDTCASGGYWIAAGCDEVWARDGSVVGSIGVIGSRPNVAALADRLGVSYERFAAGRYKDAGLPLKELDDDERAYLQGIVDDYYEQFVATVAEGRELDPEAVRDTEARVFLGPEARDRGLVDRVGTRSDLDDRLDELVGGTATIRTFSPGRRLRARLQLGATTVAYAFGAGLADSIVEVDGDGAVDGVSFRIRR
jgi:protease-4